MTWPSPVAFLVSVPGSPQLLWPCGPRELVLVSPVVELGPTLNHVQSLQGTGSPPTEKLAEVTALNW